MEFFKKVQLPFTYKCHNIQVIITANKAHKVPNVSQQVRVLKICYLWFRLAW